MDLVSELKRVTEKLALVEERLAHLEAAQKPRPPPRPAEPRMSVHGGIQAQVNTVQPMKYAAKPQSYEHKLQSSSGRK